MTQFPLTPLVGPHTHLRMAYATGGSTHMYVLRSDVETCSFAHSFESQQFVGVALNAQSSDLLTRV